MKCIALVIGVLIASQVAASISADCSGTSTTSSVTITLSSSDPAGTTWKSTNCDYGNLYISQSGTIQRYNIVVSGGTFSGSNGLYFYQSVTFPAGSSIQISGITGLVNVYASMVDSTFSIANSLLRSSSLIQIFNTTRYIVDSVISPDATVQFSGSYCSACAGSSMFVTNSNLNQISLYTPSPSTYFQKMKIVLSNNYLQQLTLAGYQAMGANITISDNVFLSQGSQSITLSGYTCTDPTGCFTTITDNSMIGPSYGLQMTSLKLGDNSLTTLRGNYMVENCISFGSSSTSTGVLDYDFASNTCSDNGRIYIAVYGPAASTMTLTMSQPIDTLQLLLFTKTRSTVTVEGANIALRYGYFGGNNLDLTVKRGLFQQLYITQITDGSVTVEDTQVTTTVGISTLTNSSVRMTRMQSTAAMSTSSWVNSTVVLDLWQINLYNSAMSFGSMTSSSLTIQHSAAVMTYAGRFEFVNGALLNVSIRFLNVTSWATSAQVSSSSYAQLRFNPPSSDNSTVFTMRDSFVGSEGNSYLLYWYFSGPIVVDVDASNQWGNNTLGYAILYVPPNITTRFFNVLSYFFYAYFQYSNSTFECHNCSARNVQIAPSTVGLQNHCVAVFGGVMQSLSLTSGLSGCSYDVLNATVTSQMNIYGASSSYRANRTRVTILNSSVANFYTGSYFTGWNLTVADCAIGGTTGYGWTQGATDVDSPSTYTFLRNVINAPTSYMCFYQMYTWSPVLGTLFVFERNQFFMGGVSFTVRTADRGLLTTRFRNNYFAVTGTALSVDGIEIDHDATNVYNSPGKAVSVTYYTPSSYPLIFADGVLGTLSIASSLAAANVSVLVTNFTTSTLSVSTAIGSQVHVVDVYTSSMSLSLSTSTNVVVTMFNVSYAIGTFATSNSNNVTLLHSSCTAGRVSMSGGYSVGGSYTFENSTFTGQSSYSSGFDISGDWWNATVLFINSTFSSASSYAVAGNSYFHLHNNSRIMAIGNSFSGNSYAVYFSYYRSGSDPNYMSSPGEGTLYFRSNTFLSSIYLDIDMVDFDGSNNISNSRSSTTSVTVRTSSDQLTPFEIANSKFYGGSLQFLNANQRVSIHNNVLTSTLSFVTKSGASNTMVRTTHNYGGQFSFQLDGTGINASMTDNSYCSFSFPSGSSFGGGVVVVENNTNVIRLEMSMSMRDMDLTVRNNEFFSSTYYDLMTWNYASIANSTVLFADNNMTYAYSSSSYATISMYSPTMAANSTITFLRNYFYSTNYIFQFYNNEAYKPSMDRKSRIVFRENTFASSCATCGYVSLTTLLQLDHDGSNVYNVRNVAIEQASDYADYPLYLNSSNMYSGTINVKYANNSRTYVTNVSCSSSCIANLAPFSNSRMRDGVVRFRNCTGAMGGYGGYSVNSSFHIEDSFLSGGMYQGQYSEGTTLVVERCSRLQSLGSFTVYPGSMNGGQLIFRDNLLGVVSVSGVSDSSPHSTGGTLEVFNNEIQRLFFSYGLWNLHVSVFGNLFNTTDTSSNQFTWSQMGAWNTTVRIVNNTFDSLPYTGWYNYRTDNIYFSGGESSSYPDYLTNTSVEIRNNTFFSYANALSVVGYTMIGRDFYVQLRDNIVRPYSSGSYFALYYSVTFSNSDASNVTLDYDGSNRIVGTGSSNQWIVGINVFEPNPFYQLALYSSYFSLQLNLYSMNFITTVWNCTIVSGTINLASSNYSSLTFLNSSLSGGTISPYYSRGAVVIFEGCTIGTYTYSGTSSTSYTSELLKNFSVTYRDSLVTSGIYISNRLNETTMQILNSTFTGDSLYFQYGSRVDNCTFLLQNNSFLGSGMVRIYYLYQGTLFNLLIYDNIIRTSSTAMELTATIFNFNPYDLSHNFVFRRNNFTAYSPSTVLFNLIGPDCDFDESNIAYGGQWVYQPQVRFPRHRFILSNSVVYSVNLYPTDSWNADHLLVNTTATTLNFYPRTSVNCTVVVDSCNVLNSFSQYLYQGNFTNVTVRNTTVAGTLQFYGAAASFNNSVAFFDSSLAGQTSFASSSYFFNTTITFNNCSFVSPVNSQYIYMYFVYFSAGTLVAFRNSSFYFPVEYTTYGMYAYGGYLANATFAFQGCFFNIAKTIAAYNLLYYGGVYGELREGGRFVIQENIFNYTSGGSLISFQLSTSYPWRGHLIYDETNTCLGCSFSLPLAGPPSNPPIVLSGGWFSSISFSGQYQNMVSAEVRDTTVTGTVTLSILDSNDTSMTMDGVTASAVYTSFGYTYNGRIFIRNSNITSTMSSSGRGSSSRVPVNSSMEVTDTTISQLQMSSSDYDDLTFVFDRCRFFSSSSYNLYLQSAYFYHFNATFSNSYFNTTSGYNLYTSSLYMYEDARLSFVNSTFESSAGGTLFQMNARSFSDLAWLEMVNVTYIASLGVQAMSLSGISGYYLNVRLLDVGSIGFLSMSINCNGVSQLGFANAELSYLYIASYNDGNLSVLMDNSALLSSGLQLFPQSNLNSLNVTIANTVITSSSVYLSLRPLQRFGWIQLSNVSGSGYLQLAYTSCTTYCMNNFTLLVDNSTLRAAALTVFSNSSNIAIHNSTVLGSCVVGGYFNLSTTRITFSTLQSLLVSPGWYTSGRLVVRSCNVDASNTFSHALQLSTNFDGSELLVSHSSFVHSNVGTYGLMLPLTTGGRVSYDETNTLASMTVSVTLSTGVIPMAPSTLHFKNSSTNPSQTSTFYSNVNTTKFEATGSSLALWYLHSNAANQAFWMSSVSGSVQFKGDSAASINPCVLSYDATGLGFTIANGYQQGGVYRFYRSTITSLTINRMMNASVSVIECDFIGSTTHLSIAPLSPGNTGGLQIVKNQFGVRSGSEQMQLYFYSTVANRMQIEVEIVGNAIAVTNGGQGLVVAGLMGDGTTMLLKENFFFSTVPCTTCYGMLMGSGSANWTLSLDGSTTEVQYALNSFDFSGGMRLAGNYLKFMNMVTAGSLTLLNARNFRIDMIACGGALTALTIINGDNITVTGQSMNMSLYVSDVKNSQFSIGWASPMAGVVLTGNLSKSTFVFSNSSIFGATALAGAIFDSGAGLWLSQMWMMQVTSSSSASFMSGSTFSIEESEVVTFRDTISSVDVSYIMRDGSRFFFNRNRAVTRNGYLSVNMYFITNASVVEMWGNELHGGVTIYYQGAEQIRIIDNVIYGVVTLYGFVPSNHNFIYSCNSVNEDALTVTATGWDNIACVPSNTVSRCGGSLTTPVTEDDPATCDNIKVYPMLFPGPTRERIVVIPLVAYGDCSLPTYHLEYYTHTTSLSESPTVTDALTVSDTELESTSLSTSPQPTKTHRATSTRSPLPTRTQRMTRTVPHTHTQARTVTLKPQTTPATMTTTTTTATTTTPTTVTATTTTTVPTTNSPTTIILTTSQTMPPIPASTTTTAETPTTTSTLTSTAPNSGTPVPPPTTLLPSTTAAYTTTTTVTSAAPSATTASMPASGTSQASNAASATAATSISDSSPASSEASPPTAWSTTTMNAPTSSSPGGSASDITWAHSSTTATATASTPTTNTAGTSTTTAATSATQTTTTPRTSTTATTTLTTTTTLAPGAARPPCPSLDVAISPLGQLHDLDFRQSGITINATAQGYATFNPLTATELSQIVVFGVATYSGEANGFEVRYGSGHHEWCNVAGTQRINCLIPPDTDYSLMAEETIVVTILNSQDLYTNWTANDCTGERMELFRGLVLASEVPAAVQVAQTMAVVSGSGAYVLGALVGAAAIDLQAIGILFQSNCASTLDHQASSPIKYFISPFYDTGVAGIVLGNFAIISVLSVAHAVTAEVVLRQRGISRLDGWAALRFPSLSYGIVQLFYLGITVGTFTGLSSSLPGEVAVGVVGLVLSAIVPAVVLLGVHRLKEARFVLYTQFLSKQPYHRWLFPAGYWTPPAVSQSYRRLIGNMNRDRQLFCVMPMVVSFLAALVMFGLTSLSCGVRLGMTAAVFFLAALTSLVSRFGRSLCLTILSSSSYCMLGMTSVLMLVSYASPTKALTNAKLAICILQIALAMLIGAYQLTIKVFEHKYWRNNRLTDFEALEQDDLDKMNQRPMLADDDSTFPDPVKYPLHKHPSLAMSTANNDHITDHSDTSSFSDDGDGGLQEMSSKSHRTSSSHTLSNSEAPFETQSQSSEASDLFESNSTSQATRSTTSFTSSTPTSSSTLH